MTKEEQNIKVKGFINGECYHKLESEETARAKGTTINQGKCVLCNKEGYNIMRDNPNYLTMNGIGLIKEWLEKEGKWYDEFIDFVYNSKGSTLVECKEMFADILTNPELFIPKFIEYMEKD